ncbi:NB-ARC domain disease resistance protein, partial [Trifolium medium]|nr:NB-ARC domain disease resistance protein [Trifolium medium]
HDDHQKHNKVRLQLPTLEHVNLCNLPGLVALSTKQYRMTCPPLVELEHNGCSQVAIKSFRGFVIHRISKSQEYGGGQIVKYINKEDVDIEGSQETIEINNEGSLNDERVSKSRLSSIASQLPSKDFPDATEVQTTSGHELSSSHENGIVSNNYEIVVTKMNATAEGKQEFVVNIPEVENSEVIVETKMNQTAEANQEFVVNVSVAN